MKKIYLIIFGVILGFVAVHAQYNDADFLARDPYAGSTFSSTGMVTSNYTIPVAEIYEPFSPSASKARKAGPGGPSITEDLTDDDKPGLPIGDATLPLLLFAAVAMGIVYLRRKKLITDN